MEQPNQLKINLFFIEFFIEFIIFVYRYDEEGWKHTIFSA